MYRVTIQLEHGCKVEFVESSIIQAAAKVEEYHGKMLWCDIQQIREEEEDGGKEDVHTEDHRQRCIS